MEEAGDSFVPSLFKPAALASLLPIAKHREELLYTIEKYPVTVVIGQTGSGKTTQLPQYLEQGGWCSDGKLIGVTQVGEFVILVSISRSRLTRYSASPGGSHVSRFKSGRGARLCDWG